MNDKTKDMEGLQAKAEEDEAQKNAGKVQVWGYKKGKAKLFTLNKGEKLPDGFSDTMPKGDHPHDKERAADDADDEAEDEADDKSRGRGGKGGK